MSEYVNLLDKLTENRVLPAGYDSWGIKSVRPDLTTCNGFRWPFPGGETGRFVLDDHDGSCPRRVGDGLCVATSWAGMASGGFPARTLLLVAYRENEARGDALWEKFRTAQVFVVDLIDGEALLKKAAKANLRDAYLEGADLRDAHLEGADLRSAYLRGADLESAHLEGAHLRRAYLRGADLGGAHLEGADLGSAYLGSADLGSADLRGANLQDANLRGAYLRGAHLEGAHLGGADLRGANLQDANLRGADLQDTVR